MTRVAPLLLLLSAALLVGCAGSSASTRVAFDGARYPVSMSPVVLDADGSPLGSEGLESLGTFESRKQGWALIWGFLPLNEVDFSDELNQQVKRLGGEAVTALRITSRESGWNMALYLHWLPFWPGSVDVEVSGLVVRRRRTD